jgi:hypothetical protein
MHFGNAVDLKKTRNTGGQRLQERFFDTIDEGNLSSIDFAGVGSRLKVSLHDKARYSGDFWASMIRKTSPASATR